MLMYEWLWDEVAKDGAEAMWNPDIVYHNKQKPNYSVSYFLLYN